MAMNIAELQAENERLRRDIALLSSANTIILRWLPTGAVTYINEYGQRFFGYTAEELLGRHVMLLVPDVESTGRDLSELADDIARHPQNYTSFVNENVCKDGSRVWVNWTNQTVTDRHGVLREILAIGTDVTGLKATEKRLKESEDKFSKAFYRSPIFMFVSTVEDGTFVEVNNAYCTLTGYSREQLIGNSSLRLGIIPAEERERIVSTMEREGRLDNITTAVRTKDGNARDTIFSADIVELQGKRCFLVSGMDITERKQVEDSLRESEHRLKLLSENLEDMVIQRTEQVHALSTALTLAEQRERKQFSHVLHDDLQQKILGARLLFKQHLRNHQAAGQTEFVDDAMRGVVVLDKAVQTAKALAIELNPPVLSTEGLDRALCWLANHMRKNYGLEVDLCLSGPVQNVRNETQLMLTQMARELLNNVKKHAGVSQCLLEASYDDRLVRISVSDTGRGFDPDEKLEQPANDSHLGLLSIRERLRLFGGNLAVQSAPGQGTRVTISLPHEYSQPRERQAT
ncbi:MAG: PAS domain S-box protein [Chitinivibrionales bacterium]|nr:PAS domain S-box protein [Chitinivibrionales bacterium]